MIPAGGAEEGSSHAQGVLLATLSYGFAINITPPLQAKNGAVVLMSSALDRSFVHTYLLPVASPALGACLRYETVNGPARGSTPITIARAFLASHRSR
ncbi:MAG: hypothetical protein GY708_11310 [Actinomycetia bacterium]|nr:hypothetical protein [Actinomycetes bacterium]